MRSIVHTGLFVLLSTPMFAQPLAFEVASIKPSKDIDPRGGLQNLAGNRLTWTNADLRFMVTFAYNVPPLQVLGGPNWATSDKFDIVAKAEGEGKRTPDEFRQMFQSLLADRFKLSFHREMRDVSVYVLTVGKNGPKNLQPKVENGNVTFRGGPSSRSGPQHLIALKLSMVRLAQLLQPELRGMALDETGITGEYSFKLDWDYDAPQSTEPGTSLFTALQEQLGLKLEFVKRPLEHLVIDRAEKPDAN